MPTQPAGKTGSSKGTTTADAPASAPALDPALTKEPSGLAVQDPPKSLGLVPSTYDADDLGAGFEGATSSDFAVPFVGILQKGSPQVEEGNPKLIPGAKAGMLINTVTGKLYDGKTGIRFIPVHRDRKFIEWIPRDDGGGFVGIFLADSPEVKEALKKAGRKFGKLKIGDNNDLVETCELYGLLLDDAGGFERVIISFASTQIPMYKRLMTTAQSIQLGGPDGRPVIPPLFSHVYRLRTEFHQKQQYTWYKWLGGFDGPDAAACRIERDHPLYAHAKEFRDLLKSGAATAAYETATNDAGEGGGEGNAGFEM